MAAARRGHFAEGTAVASLAALRDPALVLPAIAHALGVHAGGARSPEDRLVAYLGGRHMLLLLDNFEQVTAAGPALAALLGACARVTALVTSRATLQVRGEYGFMVPPLALPGTTQVADPAALTAENAAVAAICTHLEHRLTVLVGGARDLPARQQTLRDTLAWSHDLLDAGEQALFRRLGVFAGGCTLEAAEAVLGAGAGGMAGGGQAPARAGDRIRPRSGRGAATIHGQRRRRTGACLTSVGTPSSIGMRAARGCQGTAYPERVVSLLRDVLRAVA